MVERTKNGDAGSAEHSELPEIDRHDDDPAPQDEATSGARELSELDQLLARIAGRLDTAPAQGAEDASDDAGSGAVPPMSLAAAPPPGSTIEENRPDEPRQRDAGPEPEEVEPGEEVAAETAPQDRPEAGATPGDVPPIVDTAGEAAPLEGTGDEPAAPPAVVGAEESIAEAPPPESTADDASGEEEAAAGSVSAPAPSAASAWPEQWGAPSRSNVIKVLGDLLSEIEGREASPDAADGPAPGPSAPRDKRRDDAGPPAPEEAARAEATEAGVAPPRPVIPPREQPAPEIAGATARPRPEAARPATGPMGAGVKPERADPPAEPGDGVEARRRALTARWLSPLIRRGQSGQAKGGDATARAEARAPQAAGALVPDERRPGPSPHRDLVPVSPIVLRPLPLRARSAEPSPAPPSKAAPRRPPPRAREFSPWILRQPEFQRAFGMVTREFEPPGPSAEAPAAPAWRDLRTGRILAVSLAVVAFAAIAAAVAIRAPDEPSATVGEEVGPPVRAAESAIAPEPAAQPDQPVAPRAVAPVASTTTRVIPVEATAPPAATTFVSRPAGAGAGPPIRIEPTIIRGQNAGAATAPSADRARLDLAAREALRLSSEFRVDEAAGIVDEILARDPKHFGGLISRGRIDLLRDDFEGAEASFREAMSESPSSAAARLGLAEALLGQRRGAAALEVLNEVIATAPDQPAAYDLRARAHAQAGELEAMKADCETLSARANAGFVGSWCEGLAYKDAGAKAAAVASLTAAIEDGDVGFVRNRQRYLQFRGLYDGPLDGEAGPATREAVSACVEDPYC